MEGIAVMTVSRNLRQIFDLAGTIYVLRRGRMVGLLNKHQRNPEDVVRPVTGVDEIAGMVLV